MAWVLLLSFIVSGNQMVFTQIEFKDNASCIAAESALQAGKSPITTSCQPKGN